jgi:hypothetical protein
MAFFETVMLALITLGFLAVSLGLAANFISQAYVNYIATMVQLEDLIEEAKEQQRAAEEEEDSSD